MSDTIEQRVERFVQEVLDLVEQVSAEHRAAALSSVTAALAVQPPSARASSARRPAAPAAPRGERRPYRGAARAPTRRPRLRRERGAVPAAAVLASQPGEARGIAREGDEAGAPTSAAAPASAPTPAVGQVPEREARVLDAVRALGWATASEVAERSGQPNGSVVVALRALVARGLVARAKTAEGVEYSVLATTAMA